MTRMTWPSFNLESGILINQSIVNLEFLCACIIVWKSILVISNRVEQYFNTVKTKPCKNHCNLKQTHCNYVVFLKVFFVRMQNLISLTISTYQIFSYNVASYWLITFKHKSGKTYACTYAALWMSDCQLSQHCNCTAIYQLEKSYQFRLLIPLNTKIKSHMHW